LTLNRREKPVWLSKMWESARNTALSTISGRGGVGVGEGWGRGGGGVRGDM